MARKTLETLADLTPDAQNANQGTERGRGLLEHSLRKYGAGRSILADKHGHIIAGNKTLEVAADIALPVRVIKTDGKELVVVQRTDLDLSTDKAARELAYADNRVAQVDLAWDTAQLAADQAEGVDVGAFWFPGEWDDLLHALPALNTDGLDRVAPDRETAQPGVFLHFHGRKIPLTAEEAAVFTQRLDAYQEEFGTFFGFVGSLLPEGLPDE